MNEIKATEKTPALCRQHVRAFNDAIAILSGKWKVSIIGTLAAGKMRYMELQRAIEGIGPKMLSKELQELELNGLVQRSVLDAKLTSVEYELTAHGQSLKPIIDGIAVWGQQHRERIIKEMAALPPGV